jgi:hypothetical protein
MESELLLQLSQFGAAGLIGVLWILERRHAASRDRQLDEAHRRIVERERDAAVLIEVVRDNTRALSSLRGSQDRLVDLLHILMRRESAACTGAATHGTLHPA